MKSIKEGSFHSNRVNRDLTSEKSISSVLGSLISKMEGMEEDTIREKLIECVYSEEVSASKDVRSKWHDIFLEITGKTNLMTCATNFYLSAANLKSPQ